MSRSLRAALLVVCFAGSTGHAQDAATAPVTPAEICLAVNLDLTLGENLTRTAAVLRSNETLRIVAIGSSSTVGLWMLNQANTFPQVMARELTRLDPHARIEIVNSGRNGDTIPGNIARFERDVFAHNPDLVIWQIGGNDFTWLERGNSLENKIASGVQALRSTGADVGLMDQQYTPVILASQYAKMQAAIAAVAKQDHVAYFPRFDMLHKTVGAGVPLGALSAYDGLHMSGAAYDCVGRALARAIFAASR